MRGSINYFKAAERVLSNRGTLERALVNLERWRKRVIQRSAPKGIQSTDCSRPYVSGGGRERRAGGHR